ncbi:MAG: hypothetical protein VB064_11065 [Oscillospiraceae bacterium]|nr:hypothetical protein [Oscillospiraceae bacterium]
MKKILYLGISLALFLILVGCGPKESAQSIVQKAIESVKIMDVEAMQNYWGERQFKDVDSSEATTDSEAQSKAMLALLVKNLDYQIIEANEEKDTATVKVQITNIDMSSIMSEFVSQAVKEALSDAFLPEEQQPSQEEMDKKYSDILVTLLDRKDNPKVTNTVYITLSLVDNQWVIVPNEEAVDAMLGGINSFSGAMNEAFSEDSTSGEEREKDKITEIRNWVVSDIWNVGFCDLYHFEDGKSSTGQTMDPEFTMQQLNEAMEKKAAYDSYMSTISDSNISALWAKVSEQIDILYEDVKSRDLTVTGQGLDTSLYQQYFNAFDKAYSELP